MLVSKIKPCMS